MKKCLSLAQFYKDSLVCNFFYKDKDEEFLRKLALNFTHLQVSPSVKVIAWKCETMANDGFGRAPYATPLGSHMVLKGR